MNPAATMDDVVRALVECIVPLEALLLSGACAPSASGLSAEMKSTIISAVAVGREVLLCPEPIRMGGGETSGNG